MRVSTYTSMYFWALALEKRFLKTERFSRKCILGYVKWSQPNLLLSGQKLEVSWNPSTVVNFMKSLTESLNAIPKMIWGFIKSLVTQFYMDRHASCSKRWVSLLPKCIELWRQILSQNKPEKKDDLELYVIVPFLSKWDGE